MTTINNDQSLIEKVGGIEKAREIVDGAPEGAEYIDLKNEEGQVYIALDGYQFIEFDGDDWLETGYTIYCPYQYLILSLNDLRTAIAKHDEFKVGDFVVLTATGTKDVLLKIIDHKYTNDLHRVKIVKTASCGPIHKDQIRHATLEEIKAGHRIDDTTEQGITKLCIGCGSPDLHKGGEIKEPKMCLDCFAEMVGFTRTSNGFVESDEVTDIRNHVSPNTKVIDHE
ncbi:hypothetical protein [Acinetobacter bereziniae]|uniref:hypothetical protein n=1 Tax=Acinetobacter bereziniae TaxID=106648 RepID=UPI00300ACE43